MWAAKNYKFYIPWIQMSSDEEACDEVMKPGKWKKSKRKTLIEFNYLMITVGPRRVRWTRNGWDVSKDMIQL